MYKLFNYDTEYETFKNGGHKGLRNDKHDSQ